MRIISARVTDSICLKRIKSVIIWQNTVSSSVRMSSNGTLKQKLQEKEKNAREQLTGSDEGPIMGRMINPDFLYSLCGISHARHL